MQYRRADFNSSFFGETQSRCFGVFSFELNFVASNNQIFVMALLFFSFADLLVGSAAPAGALFMLLSPSSANSNTTTTTTTTTSRNSSTVPSSLFLVLLDCCSGGFVGAVLM